ncbi:TIGR02302 family protein [Xanthobacter sp. KR7-225]|uniref:TIGR02302 family protein n=1 Tax=Xanthobacter sp. KR7-225 TaxID=3156613 RepID=UPI0032B3D266
MTTPREHKHARRRAESPEGLLTRAVQRARLVIAWERLWPILVRLGVVAAAFLAASWAGLWLALPVYGRIAGVVLFALLLLAAARPLLSFTWPGRRDAIARLDRTSTLTHRPATAISDALATKPDDAVGAALWRAHLARAMGAVRRLDAGVPKPDVPAKDPRAIRALALLALVAAFFFAAGDRAGRIGAAFDWHGIAPATPYRLDAWVDPPGYTGRAPMVLPGLRSEDPTSLNALALQVPTGSVLVVRAAGIDTEALKLDGGIAEEKPGEAARAGDGGGSGDAKAAADPRPARGERRFVIRENADVSFLGPDQRRLMWHFKVVPDLVPSIAFAKDPQAGLRNALVLAYRVEDDYGIKEADAVLTPAAPEPPFFPRPGTAAPKVAPKPLVPAPEVKLTLPSGGRGGAAQTTKDLVAHPWAGAMVSITLKAKDEAGNEGVSETKTVRLPARAFTKPLARALVDERRRLALDASNRRRLVNVLAALTDEPQKFKPDMSEYLGLRTALAMARGARNDADLRALVDYLWDMAVRIEDGTLTDAERALKAAQEALRAALERGASDEEIRKLTQDLRAAMERMMRQLAEQAMRDRGANDRPLDQNTRIMRPQDLQKMLDRIEDLARSGNKEAARQLLDELQAMMENMRPGNRQAGRGQQGQQQSELGAMIQEQQRLRDRTFRQGQQGQQGQRGQQGQGDPDGFDQLQQGQQDLRRRLGRMLDQLRRMQPGQPGQQGQGQQGQGQQGQGQQGQSGGGEGQDDMARAGDQLGRAEQAMREAEEALGRGDGQGALDAEGRALQALRQGAQSMAQAQQGNDRGPGPGGPGEDAAQRVDPLGRPLRSQDYGDDFTVKVPDEVDAQRARRVLEELRRRLEQPLRPQIELDYLERLLKGL